MTVQGRYWIPNGKMKQVHRVGRHLAYWRNGRRSRSPPMVTGSAAKLHGPALPGCCVRNCVPEHCAMRLDKELHFIAVMKFGNWSRVTWLVVCTVPSGRRRLLITYSSMVKERKYRKARNQQIRADYAHEGTHSQAHSQRCNMCNRNKGTRNLLTQLVRRTSRRR